MLKTIQGSFNQAGVDVSSVTYRHTGALHAKKQGILPRYVKLRIELDDYHAQAAASVMLVSFGGVSSGVVLEWQVGGGCAAYPGVLEWYAPVDFPVLMDEMIYMTTESIATGRANLIHYRMDYEVVDVPEVQFTQEMARYEM